MNAQQNTNMIARNMVNIHFDNMQLSKRQLTKRIVAAVQLLGFYQRDYGMTIEEAANTISKGDIENRADLY